MVGAKVVRPIVANAVPSQVRACEEVAGQLALVVDQQSSPSRALLIHIDRCLSCQADLVHYRTLLRMLAELRDEADRLPAGVLADLLGNISRATERRALRDLLMHRRSAYLVGIGISIFVVSGLLGLVRIRSHRSGGGRRRPEESGSTGC